MNSQPDTQTLDIQTQSFTDRLVAVRAADKKLNIKRSTAALSGQLSCENEDSSSWNNFGQYFKFASIAKI